MAKNKNNDLKIVKPMNGYILVRRDDDIEDIENKGKKKSKNTKVTARVLDISEDISSPLKKYDVVFVDAKYAVQAYPTNNFLYFVPYQAIMGRLIKEQLDVK